MFSFLWVELLGLVMWLVNIVGDMLVEVVIRDEFFNVVSVSCEVWLVGRLSVVLVLVSVLVKWNMKVGL